MSYLKNEEGYVYSNGEKIVNLGMTNKGLIYIIEKRFEANCLLKEFIIEELKKRLNVEVEE